MPTLEIPQEDMDHDHVDALEVIAFYDANVEKTRTIAREEGSGIVGYKIMNCKRCYKRYQRAIKYIKAERGEKMRAKFADWFERRIPSWRRNCGKPKKPRTDA